MRARRLVALTALLFAAPAGAQTETAGAYDPWGALLARYVAGDHVDYARWKAENPAEWGRFLAWLEEADPSRFSMADQRAFWINAYNARVVAGVLARYPLDSVRDVGFFGGRFRGFFEREEHPVAGQRRSLEDMRRIVTRPPLGEPIVHFALTMAAESSPPLRPEPYRGVSLDTQLDFQARTFLNTPEGHQLDARGRRLLLTPILSWFADDFERGGGSVRSFAVRYLIDGAAAATGAGWPIEWLEFDWRLDQSH